MYNCVYHSDMADLVIPVGYGLWNFELTHATIAHKAIVTCGFKVLTPPYTQTDAADALSAFATAMQPLHDNEVTYGRVVALIGNDGPAIRYEATGSVQGSRASQVIAPPNVTYLIKKTTSFAGRRYRGRMYIPFVSITGITQTGSLSGAELTILVARASALLTGLVGATPNTSELSILHAESSLSALPAPTPVTALSAEAVVATQRRRLERS
jgi:hypothetical protein